MRVAGCLPGSRVRTAAATSVASCAVRREGLLSRALTMACATRRAKRSSPKVAITWRISSMPARASQAATGSPRVGSMRISSGPSARKLKPRRGVIELRRRYAKIEEHAPARAIASVCAHDRAEVGKRRVHERKPHFVGKAAAAGLDGLRIPVECEQAALPTQGLENECRMTAAPERRIDIVTARFQGQPRERLCAEHRCVLIHVRSGPPPPP